MQESPYTPSSIARDLVGREQHLRQANMMLTTVGANKLAEQLRIYVGPRGVGKTSLMRSIEDSANARGFNTVWVTAGDGVVVQEIVAGLEQLLHTRAAQISKALLDMLANIKVSIAGVSVSGPGSSRSDGSQPKVGASLGRQLQELLVAIGQAFKKDNETAGLGLFIDEIQLADGPSIRALAYTWQHLQSEGADLPLFCLMSGLSHSQDVITEYASFGERFRYIHLSNLDNAASVEALQRPAANKAVRWEDQALLTAADTAAGYPYFLQLIGDSFWEAADFPDPGAQLSSAITPEAVKVYNDRLQQFYRSRWMKATEGEQHIMVAMAELGDAPVRRGDVAQRMGKPSSALSMQRQSLMDKGLVESSDWGLMSFTAPGFAEYIRSQNGL